MSAATDAQRKANHERAPQSAAFMSAMREAFEPENVILMYVCENGFETFGDLRRLVAPGNKK